MEPIKILPVREQVADALRRAIFNGEIRRGEELTQEGVATRLGVSRMPVREAFLMLERDGLLILNSHRKAVVRGLTAEDIIEHYDIRSLLEGEAAARACTCEDKTDIRSAYEQVERAGRMHDAAAFVEANLLFHRTIWEAAGNAYLVQLIEQLWNGLPPHLPELVPEQMDHSLREHEEMVEAILYGNPAAARDATTRHIQRSMKQFLASFRDT
jgi:DNA-binding GntR family transcriptional regulator